jgi:MutS domain V/Inorganic pyrophosphatase
VTTIIAVRVHDGRREVRVARVSEDEVLLLWRALMAYRSGPRPACQVQFYAAYAAFIAPMKAAGLEFCYPAVSAAAKQVSAKGSFDLALAAKLMPRAAAVIRNDFRLESLERIFVVTGPNHGGKTTFARMFGQLHYLASLGYPVPAAEATLFLPDRVFTHFEREEDLATLHGKFEEELVRIRGVLEEATGDSVLVMNESFASTTLRDASFVGERVLGRMTDLGLLGVYVTFVDELASMNEACVSMVATVVPDNPAERTYELVRNLTAEIGHFFDIYKELEPGKDTDVRGWQDRAAAEQVIEAAFTRARASAPGHSEVQSFRRRTSRPSVGDARG